MAISTNGTIITRLAGALYGEYLSNASYTELKDTSAATVAADWLKNDFAGKTDAQLAATILKNTGLSGVAGLDNYVIGQLANAPAGKGAKIVEMLNFFAGLSADATWGSYATAFNAKVAAGLVLSQTAGTTGGDFATAGTAPISGGTFALTTGADVADNVSSTRGALASTFKFTSGNDAVTGTVNTLTTTDVLVDGSTEDNDTLTVAISAATDSAGASFTTENIETFNITAGAAGNGDLDMTNVTGLKTLNVSGTGNFTVSDLDAQTLHPTIAVNNYARVLTVDAVSFAGTTKGENAETVNLSVSGATYGTLTSTQTAVVVGASADGTLEQLNITSAGTKANEFALSVGSNDAFSKVDINGTTALSVRMTQADASGLVITGAAGSNATVKINTESGNAVDATNFSGVTVALYDPTPSELDKADASLKDGGGITYLNNVKSSALTVQGALYTALAGAVSVTLDNSKDDTNVTLPSLGVQNVKAITINSNGNSTEDAKENTITTLTGDFSTVTIKGDTAFKTSLAIDAVQSATAETGARAVTVSAAGLTGIAYADITAGASLYTSYSITGTANDDVLAVASTATLGATLNGGAGDDDLTGALGADTINGGDGDDTVTITYGADKVTGGAGVDTYVVDNATGTATAQVSKVSGLTATLENSGNADIVATASGTADVFNVLVDGVSYSVDIGHDGDLDGVIYADFVTAYNTASGADTTGVAVELVSGKDAWTVDFNIADIGRATVGDTVTVSVDWDASGTDCLIPVALEFTKTELGTWTAKLDGVATKDYSLGIAGSEVTVTRTATSSGTVVDADQFDVYASGSASDIAARGAGNEVVTISLGGSSESAALVSNDYLKFTGRDNGAAFSISASFIDSSASKTYTVGSSTSIAGVTAPDTNTTFTDFSAEDVLEIGLMTGDVTVATSLIASNIDDANVFLLTTGTGYASVKEAEIAVAAAQTTPTGAGLIVFLNSTTGKVQAFIDTNMAQNTLDTTAEYAQATLFTFDNLTSLVGISTTFSEDSFAFTGNVA